jgi:hypothetical protein
MPRPKPPQELKVRAIRLTDTQMAALKLLGGAPWLRAKIMACVKVGALQRERNRRVRVDRASGMSLKAVAKKHKLAERTVITITGTTKWQ